MHLNNTTMTEEEINKMNNLIEQDNFSADEFYSLLMPLQLKYNFEIKVIDYEYYNEKRMKEAKQKKEKCVCMQNFQKAAWFRDIEMKCLQHLHLIFK